MRVFAFILVLFVPQLIAFFLQFKEGFVPFVHEPRRIALSWDMFSTPVERCRLAWEPPVSLPGKALGSFVEMGTRLEWDPMFDHVDEYRQTGQVFCLLGGGKIAKSRIVLDCFLPSGVESRDDIPCP